MLIIEGKGLVFSDSVIPRVKMLVLRVETRGGFTTLSLSDDEHIMLQIVVDSEIRKVLKKL